MQKLESNFNALNNIVGHVTPSTGIRKSKFQSISALYNLFELGYSS